MELSIRNKSTRIGTTVKYQEWMHDIVRKGMACNYEIINYWRIVWVETKIFGKWRKYEITEKEFAEKLINNHPTDFRIKLINIEKQITKDYKTSSYCGRFRLLSWLFFTIHQVPIIRLNKQRNNNIIMVWLMLLTILVMFYLARQEGII